MHSSFKILLELGSQTQMFKFIKPNNINSPHVARDMIVRDPCSKESRRQNFISTFSTSTNMGEVENSQNNRFQNNSKKNI